MKNLDGSLVASALRNVMNGLYKLQGETILGCCEVNSSECEAFTIMANFIKLAVFRYIGKHSKTLAFS